MIMRALHFVVLLIALHIDQRFGVAGNNVVLLCGGPGEWDEKDPEKHDKTWHPFVTSPQLMANNRAIGRHLPHTFHWIVYKPAYEKRWATDLRSDSIRVGHTENVKNKKDNGGKSFTSYVNLIEGRARERGWTLHWINSNDEFWPILESLKDPIDEFYYWGHASHGEDGRDASLNGLWLTLDHDPTTHVGVAPHDPRAIIATDEVAHHKSLQRLFASLVQAEPGKPPQESPPRFAVLYGCNTYKFAEALRDNFDISTIGFKHKITFAFIHGNPWDPQDNASKIGAPTRFDYVEPPVRANGAPERMKVPIGVEMPYPVKAQFQFDF